MKKRFPALFLALALCLGLAAPAFAADKTASSAPNVQISLPGGAEPQVSAKTFQIRQTSANKVTLNNKETNESFSAFVVARASEPESYTLPVLELPLGTKITVSDLRNDWGNKSGEVDVVRVEAYSDPDGDGVYDQWIYDFDQKPPVVPLTEDRVSSPDGNRYFDRAYLTKDNSLGRDIDVLPSSITISTDYLNEVFGPNTLVVVEVEVWTVIDPNSVTALPTGSSGAIACFITGEKAADTPNGPAFTDVPAGQWYAGPVAWAVEKNITNGTSTTTFSPGKDCTQAQILTFLYRAARGEGAATPEDMDKAISWAREKGMIDDSFDGSKPCTRSAAVSYIWQAFDKPTAKASSFTDVDANAAYAQAVSWAVEKGVTNGYGSSDTFAPGRVCSRGEIAAFLYRAYNN